jgi:D-alanyl-D-alanine carboxypeptidase
METEMRRRRNPDFVRRAQQRAKERRRSFLRILAVGIPCMALLLLTGRYAAQSFPTSFTRSDKSKEHTPLSVLLPRSTAAVQAITADELTQMAEYITASSDSGEKQPNQSESSQDTSDDWRLFLVNPWNFVPEDYKVALTQFINGHAIDERCYPDLQEMMDDCHAAGYAPLICSSYRTFEKQKQLFDDRVVSVMAQGYSEAEAKIEAAMINAVPGTSEHQLGLAVDIVDVNNQNLDESQEETATQKWLMQNSWKYGFILRYPAGKSDVTGIIYEPWHYRYVGRDAAKEIFETGVCLEEYLEQLA